jgi:hypothetical protein
VKVKLQAGQELEFVTPGELHQIMQEVLAGYLRPPQTVRPIGSVNLNASGNSCRSQAVNTGTAAAVAIDLYEIPVGYRFRLHRMVVKPDGFTFGVPFTNGAGFLDILRGDLMYDGISFASPGLPQIWSAGTADGIDYANGDVVRLLVSGGPPSVNLAIRMQGTLSPHVEQ